MPFPSNNSDQFNQFEILYHSFALLDFESDLYNDKVDVWRKKKVLLTYHSIKESTDTEDLFKYLDSTLQSLTEVDAPGSRIEKLDRKYKKFSTKAIEFRLQRVARSIFQYVKDENTRNAKKTGKYLYLLRGLEEFNLSELNKKIPSNVSAMFAYDTWNQNLSRAVPSNLVNANSNGFLNTIIIALYATKPFRHLVNNVKESNPPLSNLKEVLRLKEMFRHFETKKEVRDTQPILYKAESFKGVHHPGPLVAFTFLKDNLSTFGTTTFRKLFGFRMTSGNYPDDVLTSLQLTLPLHVRNRTTSVIQLLDKLFLHEDTHLYQNYLPPPILLLHANRFENHQVYRTSIQYQTMIDLTPYCHEPKLRDTNTNEGIYIYELYAVIHHVKNHYVVDVTFDGLDWWRYDDRKDTPEKIEIDYNKAVVTKKEYTKTAFMFFYRAIPFYWGNQEQRGL